MDVEGAGLNDGEVLRLSSEQEVLLSEPVGNARLRDGSRVTRRTMLEAFALLFDGASLRDVDEVIGLDFSYMRSARGAKRGWVYVRGMEECPLTTSQMLRLTDGVRARLAQLRVQKGEQRFGIEKAIENQVERQRARMQRAVDAVLDGLVERMDKVDKRGTPLVRLSGADVLAAVKAQNLLEGKATQIVEHQHVLLETVGQMLAKNMLIAFPNDIGGQERMLRLMEADLALLDAGGYGPEARRLVAHRGGEGGRFRVEARVVEDAEVVDDGGDE